MTIPAVPVVPVVPNRTADNETEYRENVDAYHAAIPGFSSGLNVTSAAINDTAAIISAQTDQVAEGAESAQEIYELIAALNLTQLSGASTTSVAIGYGIKSFAASTGKLWRAGLWLELHSASDVTKFLAGPVTSYDRTTGALSVDAQVIGGSGSVNDWSITATYPGPSLYQAIGSAVATTSGSAWTWTNIPSGYADLLFEVNGVFGSAYPVSFQIETSINNGAAWSTATTLQSVSVTNPFGGQIRADHYSGALVAIPNFLSDPAIAFALRAGPINAIRLSLSTGTGTAGSIQLYGK